jgi:hypothetical protein
VTSAVGVGAVALVDWLSDGAEADGLEWPGRAHPEIFNDWEWLIDGWCAWREAGIDETAGASCSLIDTVIPRLLVEDAYAISSGGATGMLFTDVDTTDLEAARASVRTMLQIGADTRRGYPPVLRDIHGRYWVAPGAELAVAYASACARTREQVESRLADAGTLAEQIGRHADDPDWARYGKRSRGLYIGRQGIGMCYRRLSALASQRLESRR